MRPPPSIFEDLALTAGAIGELLLAMEGNCSEDERVEMRRLNECRLPPVVSMAAMAAMTGFSPGFLWSLMYRTNRHYRVFQIPKGRSSRLIEAPRVGLKFVQKWLAIQFERAWTPDSAVHGFVKGRSHISAAAVHLGAHWVVSVDIENFFPSTNEKIVRNALERLGYRFPRSLEILSRICCYERRLPQGAPTSPVLSNIALHEVDCRISNLAWASGWNFTRYADDIVLSGTGRAPTCALREVEKIFARTCWSLSPRKRFEAEAPQRLKVHGLLVHGDSLRLTKGYRNRIRAYRHLWNSGRIAREDQSRVGGHIQYAGQIERYPSCSEEVDVEDRE